MNITPKQIAQTYVLNDIVAHELILAAIDEIEKKKKLTNKQYSKFDIVNKLCSIVSQDDLFVIFELSKSDILEILKNEYSDEIDDLVLLD